MPTNINKNTIKDLGNVPDNVKIEKTIEKADSSLQSVERIAGKVENIINLITKFKDMGNKGQNSKTTLTTSLAPRIEQNVNNAMAEKKEEIKRSAKIKINTKEIKENIIKFLDVLDDKKTIKEIKEELKQLDKLGKTEETINNFILKSCQIVYG